MKAERQPSPERACSAATDRNCERMEMLRHNRLGADGSWPPLSPADVLQLHPATSDLPEEPSRCHTPTFYCAGLQVPTLGICLLFGISLFCSGRRLKVIHPRQTCRSGRRRSQLLSAMFLFDKDTDGGTLRLYGNKDRTS